MVDIINQRGYELAPGDYEFDDLYDLLMPDDALEAQNNVPLNVIFALGSQEPDLFDMRMTQVGLNYQQSAIFLPHPAMTTSQRTFGTQPAGFGFAGGVETFSEEIYLPSSGFGAA